MIGAGGLYLSIPYMYVAWVIICSRRKHHTKHPWLGTFSA